MPLFRQIAMRPGAYETAEGRQFKLTERDLARCRENTLALMARGWQVPVFFGHVEYASGEGGPRLEVPGESPWWIGRASSSTAVGNLVDITLEPDGSLAHVIRLRRYYLRRLIRARTRFTSPEIRPSFTAAPGETLGPVIAHIALTRRPLCRGQTRLARMRPSDTEHHAFFQSHFLDTKGNDMSHNEDFAATEVPPVQLAGEAAGDALSPFDRPSLAERIRRSRKLPRGLRERLCEFVETLQLSADTSGEPVVPVAEAVSMIEAAVPEYLSLDEDELETPPHPRGEDFFRGHSSEMSDEEADRIAAEQLAASGFLSAE